MDVSARCHAGFIAWARLATGQQQDLRVFLTWGFMQLSTA